MGRPRHKARRGFLRRHSLSIVAILLLTTWICGYVFLDPKTHLGSFFGNAIADWSGSVVIILGTKFLYEVGSAESRQTQKHEPTPFLDLLYRHSLLIFLLVTGIGWAILFVKMDSESKWGTGRGQYRFRVGANGRPRFPDQTPGRDRIQGKSLGNA